jgi:hypothetical protein
MNRSGSYLVKCFSHGVEEVDNIFVFGVTRVTLGVKGGEASSVLGNCHTKMRDSMKAKPIILTFMSPDVGIRRALSWPIFFHVIQEIAAAEL